MSTHIPADYFTKPILARLGVGKRRGCNGWILLPATNSPPALRRVPNGGTWDSPAQQVVWDHDGIDGATRAFCGAIAPTGDRILRVEGPLPADPEHLPDYRHSRYAYGRAIPRRPFVDSGGRYGDRGPWILEAQFPGERTIGYVQIEREAERMERVWLMVDAAIGLTAPRAKWVQWQEENAEKCRARVVLYLPRRSSCGTCDAGPCAENGDRGGPCSLWGPEVPDFAAIDCPRCLAAWDVFVADTGATVEVIPRVELDDDPDLDEPFGAGAGDRGGRW